MDYGDAHCWFASPKLVKSDNTVVDINIRKWEFFYSNCNYELTLKDDNIFLAPATLSGSVTRHSDSSISATFDLIKVGADTSCRTLFVTDGSYSFDGITFGDYTLRVTLKNHVTQSYDIKIDGVNVVQNVELWLLGDTTKDGKVNIIDLVRMKKAFAAASLETGVYDVNEDGVFNSLDMSALVKNLLSCGNDAYMYIDWNESDRYLQVVQSYSETEDFVMIMKPQSLNEIFNIAPGKFVTATKDGINSDLSSAYYRDGQAFVESDWFGPHIINGDWTGGTHVTNNGTMHTGTTTDVTLTVDGEEVTGNVAAYADTLTVSWNNDLYFTGSETRAMVEHYNLSFDGEVWKVDCSLEVVSDLTWKTFYGIQCVYGYWYDNIYFNGGEANSINVPASGGNAYCVYSDSKIVDTMTVNKDNDWLDMGIDRSYGLGDRSYVDSDSGAFAINYGSPNAGKAYFALVNSNGGVEMKSGDTIGYRGFYRFYSK